MNTFDSKYMQLKETKLKNIINKQATVIAVAAELSVSRQTVHAWLARYKRFGIDGLIAKKKTGCKQAHNRTSQEIEQLVINCSKDHYTSGVQDLSDWLMYENNIQIHPTTIYRILKRRNIRYTTKYPDTRKRWKKQLYAHQIPGQELQMDTKYPFGYKQGKVIYTIIDDATRWVFAYSYETANTLNTLDFLHRVLQKAPFPIQKIRTDQGKEFIALKVKSFLQENNIVHRANTPYCPEENGKIERFHRTLNQNALPFGFSPNQSLDHLQYRLTLFLHYYNWVKRHRGLGMNGQTPVQRLNELKSVNLTLQCYKN